MKTNKIFNNGWTNIVLLLTGAAVLVLCFVCRGSFGASELPASSAVFRVENYTDGEVVHYPVALLKGRVDGIEQGRVVVENLSSAAPSRIMSGGVYDGRFKVLAELVEGENRLVVAVGGVRTELQLVYRRSSNPRFVRLVFFTDASGNDEFYTPDEWTVGRTAGENEQVGFVRKLQVAALLWQTATAERLYDAGYGRRTFTLETDASGEVVVWKQRGRKSSEEYCALSETERFHEICGEVFSGPAFVDGACFFVLTSLKGAGGQGKVALGSDNVAMLDAGSFFSWPSRLDEALDFFSDSTPVSSEYARDSAYRNVRWALTASSLGAGLHELGHAFGLKHTDDPNDFMSRGFDRFNRIFMVFEPSSALSDGGPFPDKDVVEWTKSTAPTLIRSLWIER